MAFHTCNEIRKYAAFLLSVNIFITVLVLFFISHMHFVLELLLYSSSIQEQIKTFLEHIFNSEDVLEITKNILEPFN